MPRQGMGSEPWCSIGSGLSSEFETPTFVARRAANEWVSRFLDFRLSPFFSEVHVGDVQQSKNQTPTVLWMC
jgi:hypothetical protein